MSAGTGPGRGMRTYRAIDVADVVTAYGLGRKAGHREAELDGPTEPYGSVGQPSPHLDGLTHAQYWRIYSDVMNDLGGIGEDGEDES